MDATEVQETAAAPPRGVCFSLTTESDHEDNTGSGEQTRPDGKLGASSPSEEGSSPSDVVPCQHQEHQHNHHHGEEGKKKYHRLHRKPTPYAEYKIAYPELEEDPCGPQDAAPTKPPEIVYNSKRERKNVKKSILKKSAEVVADDVTVTVDSH